MLSDARPVPASSNSNADLDQVLSRFEGVETPPPPLKKRGGKRPGAGRKAHVPKVDPAIEEIKADLSGKPNSEPHSENPGNQTAGPVATPPPFDIPAHTLVPILKPLVRTVPFGFLSAKTGFSGFELEKDEEQELAEALAGVAAIYAEKINPKHVPALICAAAFSSALLMKSTAYFEWKKQQSKKPPSETPPGDPAPAVYHPPEPKAA